MNQDYLLERIKKGDEKVLQHIYKENFASLCHSIYKWGGNEEQAKDIYQECLIIFWQNCHKDGFELTSKISTYLYSICHNLWLKEFNRSKKFTKPSPVEEGIHDDSVEKIEQKTIIRKCISQMNDTCKKILGYYYFDGMKMEVIAERMNFNNSNSVKTQKYKCKKKLDKYIKSHFSETDFRD
ncbi:MAG: sigma-70 family RNA polymerase sigma factor [Cytophagales bacterium]|nr:sigma-70 family RNA polymerase sigma factor [Cytophagales bacterium]